jgi:hypothetical protein
MNAARLIVSLIALSTAAVGHAETYALIVSGLGGEAQYEQRFEAQAHSISIAAEKLTGSDSRVTSLVGEGAKRDAIRQAMRTLAGKAGKSDRVMIVLIGHGSFDGEEYRFNVPGPDLTATEFGQLLNQVDAGEQLIVNGTSASGAVVDRWKRDGRIIVSATKNGGERTATRFPQFWLEAVTGPAADINKDDIVTAAEAFDYAARRVAESFKSDVSLATEHARLEGDGANKFQVARLGAAALAVADSGLNLLMEQRVKLERDIESVKERKAALPEEAYYDELEAVLVRLALLQKQIDAQAARPAATTSMLGGSNGR